MGGMMDAMMMDMMGGGCGMMGKGGGKGGPGPYGKGGGKMLKGGGKGEKNGDDDEKPNGKGCGAAKGCGKGGDKGFSFDKGGGKGDKGGDFSFDKGADKGFDKGFDKGAGKGCDKGADKGFGKGCDKGCDKGWGKGCGMGKGMDMGCGSMADLEYMMEAMKQMIAMQEACGGGGNFPTEFNDDGTPTWSNKKWGERDWDIWNSKKIDKVDKTQLPTIVGISIHPACKLVAQEGYPSDIAALEYNKDQNIFSESHHILTAFFEKTDVREAVQLVHDPDGTQFPEVHEAWRAAHQADNTPTVALCPKSGQWAVGFGGKKFAERAAKLALSLTLAAVSEPEIVKKVTGLYPEFGALCLSAGMEVPGYIANLGFHRWAPREDFGG